jgi:7-cyano-7-deazaguanine synthase
MKTVVLLSGGMDSATALAWAINNHHEVMGTVSFFYGSKHNAAEYQRAIALCEYYKVSNKRFSLDFVSDSFKSDLLQSGGEIPEGHYADESMKRTVVPFRNGIMLAIATGYAESIGADSLILANHCGDHAIYPDCRKEFTDAFAAAMENGTYNRVKLLSPFGQCDKTEIARIGHHLGVPYHLTWSCYKGGQTHCGKCGTCVERKEAFALSNVEDPTEYES